MGLSTQGENLKIQERRDIDCSKAFQQAGKDDTNVKDRGWP